MQDLIEKWNSEGYLILEKFYSPDDIHEMDVIQDNAWTIAREDGWIYDLTLGTRKRRGEISAKDRETHRFKFNDLFVESHTMRKIALDRRLSAILEQLMGSPPVLIGSMQTLRGSGQGFHTDGRYVPTVTSGCHLVSSWLALEDVSADAGPIFFYPGSHKLPPFCASDWPDIDSKRSWNIYMEEQVFAHDLTSQPFLGKAGDVMLIHPELVHGGVPISNHRLTRRSCVFQYHSEYECAMRGLATQRCASGVWLDLRAELVKS